MRRVMVTAKPPWQPLQIQLKEKRLMVRRVRRGFMAQEIKSWLVKNGAKP